MSTGTDTGSSVVRVGIIGTGGMGQAHCAGIGKVAEARLTAICDIDPTTATKVGQEYNVPFFTDYRRLLRARLCDAVLVATPHPVRPPIAIAALQAGLHVLSEKPLSERISTADKMVATARAQGRVLGIMFQRRTEPLVQKAVELVRAGALGKIYRTTLISPEYRSQFYYDSGTWRATWGGEGGGVMMNQSPHILDVFVQLGGMPCEVFGRTETRLHRIEVEDLAEALLTYPDGGTGYFYCSTNEAGPGQMIEIFGDKGKLIFRDGQMRFFQFEPSVAEFTRSSNQMWGGPKCTEVPIEVTPGDTGHQAILRNFCRHILFGEPLLSPGADGLLSLEVANAVWLSAHLKKPVKLPLSRKAYDAFLAKKRRTSTFVKVVGKTQRVTDPRIG